jgi:hypothetical protein
MPEEPAVPVAPPSDKCNYENEDSDALYEAYRRGLVTRHMGANGRVDQDIWLRQISMGWDHPVLKHHWRWREEKATRANGAPLGQDDAPVMMGWVPLARHWDLPPGRISTSFAGGDNPLMNGGLALASFSLEALSRDGNDRPVSEHALYYAQKVFDYILECEMPGKGGYFLRIESYHSRFHPYLASLDELLGLAVGIRYYFEALRSAGLDTEPVRALTERMARCMRAHGYWIFPWAEDYRERPAFLEAAFHDASGDSVVGKQLGWIFGAAFRALFQYVTGEDYRADWDDAEYDAYCVPWINIFGKKGILGKTNSAAVDTVNKVTVDGEHLFRLLCDGVSAAHDSSASPSYWSAVLDALTVPAALPFAALHALVNGPLSTAEQIMPSVLALAYEQLKKSFFNFNMFALASLLLLECGNPGEETRASIQGLMSRLLSDPDGKSNSLFALVLRRAGGSALEAREGIEVLTAVARGEQSEVFAHDLGLKTFDLAEAILASAATVEEAPTGEPVKPNSESPTLEPAEPEPQSPADAAVAEARLRLVRICEVTKESRDSLLSLLRDLPVSFHRYQQFGGSITWDTRTSIRATPGSVGGYSPKGTDYLEVVKELVCGPGSRDVNGRLMAMTLEASGSGYLFARMLASHWGYLPPPSLGAGDEKWSPLPFVGATPYPHKRITASGLTWERVEDCSFIHRICYDRERSILFVCFDEDSYYEYTGVPPEPVEAFRTSRDKGDVFNSLIRNQFAFRRLF